MALPEVYIPSFYNAMQQGRADKRTAMLNSLQDQFMISQKQMADEQRKSQLAYNIADYIDQEGDETVKSTLYAEAVPQLSKLFPDMQLPPTYSKQAILSIKAKTSPYIPVEYKSAGNTLYRLQGSDVTAVGGGDDDEGKIVVRRDVKDGVPVDVSLYQWKNKRKDLQEGEDIFNPEYPLGVNAKKYYEWLDAQKPPEAKPPTVNKVPSLAIQQAVQAQATGNTAGMTNVATPIESDTTLQPTPMPSTVQPPLSQAMPPQAMPMQGINALIPDAMFPDEMNRFATLQPFGSQPMNRLGGSMGIEGFEQAYVGSDGQPAMPPKPVGGVVRARPVPQQAPRSNYIPAPKAVLQQYNIDPLLQSAQIDKTTGELTVINRVTKEQALIEKLQAEQERIKLLEAQAGQGKSQAELKKAKADSDKAIEELQKIRDNKVVALSGIIKMEDALNDMIGNQFIDTGRYEQIMQFTPTAWGAQQRRLADVTKESADAVKSYIRIAGQGDLNKSEQEWAVGVYPDIGLDLPSNISRVKALKQRFMKYNNVEHIVRTPEELARLPVGTVYFNPITSKKMIKVQE
jgi:hypothetical protein